MANANIDALTVGSLRINIHIYYPSNFTFYKWCITKVAHCTSTARRYKCNISDWIALVTGNILEMCSFNMALLLK